MVAESERMTASSKVTDITEERHAFPWEFGVWIGVSGRTTERRICFTHLPSWKVLKRLGGASFDKAMKRKRHLRELGGEG